MMALPSGCPTSSISLSGQGCLNLTQPSEEASFLSTSQAVSSPVSCPAPSSSSYSGADLACRPGPTSLSPSLGSNTVLILGHGSTTTHSSGCQAA